MFTSFTCQSASLQVCSLRLSHTAPNMAALSSDRKQRIAIRCTQSNRLLVYIEMWDKFVDRTFWEICLSFKILILPPCQQSAFLWLSEKDSAWIEENLCWGCARLKFRIQSQQPCVCYNGLSYDHRLINKRMLALEKPVWREKTRLTIVQKFRLR